MVLDVHAALLAPYNVSRESQQGLQLYVEILEHWQKSINLVGPSTLNTIWTRHIVDCLQLLPLIGRGPQRIADLGAGAGLPGIVLAIAGGHTVHLYESNGKKAAFLREAVRKTSCPAVVHQTRIEELASAPDVPAVDFVVSRAFAPLPRLLDYARPFLEQGARALFHKGQDVDVELTEATKYWKMNYNRHPSVTESGAVILEILEARRVS